MRVRSAALAALIVASCVAGRAFADDRLTLDEAFARVLDVHPDLKIFRYTRQGLDAEVGRAALAPVLTAAFSTENVLGTGAASGVRAAELTVSLASVIERGGKRDVRIAVASRRIDALAEAEEARRLDVLAEVARRYLDVVAAAAAVRIADADVAQREYAVSGATRRVQRGAAPVSTQLAAEAQRARARLERRRAEHEQLAAYRRLALLWGERDPQPMRDVGEALATPRLMAFDEITILLASTPDLRRFASEARLREARVQLAHSARVADIEWQVGMRRLQASSDWALVGSVSMPLGAGSRAGPDIRAAEAELAALDLERESAELGLHSTLAQAHGRLAASISDAIQLRDEVLPLLAKAGKAAENAYRAGASSYLEWAQLQSEMTTTRRQQLAAIVDAQRALIEIQRLTGTSFAIAGPADKESTP